MDFEWVAIALGDVVWISLAFLLGFAARFLTLPPMVGFLMAGFVLQGFGFGSGEILQKLADLGITLLLFSIGLKLNIKMLIQPQVWAVTALHTSVITIVFGFLVYGLVVLGLPAFAGLDFKLAMMLGFALSFSSTVFVVKILEEKGESKSLHGRLAVAILVMQDIAAVTFLAFSLGKYPSVAALLLLLLIPLRPALFALLQRTGHGELLVLYGLVLALGGAEIFELVGIKDDLGALVMGVLISAHPKSKEMAKALLSLKDVFLVGFFLTIGLSGHLNAEVILIACALIPLVLFKSALFYGLMTGFKLRARTALLAALSLGNYSEFGLIVIAIGVANGWLDPQWLVVMAVALSLSFVLAAPFNNRSHTIYSLHTEFWRRLQRSERLADDIPLNIGGVTTAVFGMGRVGSSAYDKLQQIHGEKVLGIDFDSDRIAQHSAQGRKVLRGDPSDPDFWDKVDKNHSIGLILLALPNVRANMDALEQLREIQYSGRIAATARFPDEELLLREAGVDAVFNIYTEAGTGFAEHVEAQLQQS